MNGVLILIFLLKEYILIKTCKLYYNNICIQKNKNCKKINRLIRDFTPYADIELIKHNTTLKTKIKKNPYYESIFIYHYKYDLETYPHINIKKCIYNPQLYSYISMFIYIYFII